MAAQQRPMSERQTSLCRGGESAYARAANHGEPDSDRPAFALAGFLLLPIFGFAPAGGNVGPGGGGGAAAASPTAPSPAVRPMPATTDASAAAPTAPAPAPPGRKEQTYMWSRSGRCVNRTGSQHGVDMACCSKAAGVISDTTPPYGPTCRGRVRAGSLGSHEANYNLPGLRSGLRRGAR